MVNDKGSRQGTRDLLKECSLFERLLASTGVQFNDIYVSAQCLKQRRCSGIELLMCRMWQTVFLSAFSKLFVRYRKIDLGVT